MLGLPVVTPSPPGENVFLLLLLHLEKMYSSCFFSTWRKCVPPAASPLCSLLPQSPGVIVRSCVVKAHSREPVWPNGKALGW